MSLLQYKEFINTECSNISQPILSIKALKIDANNKQSLKNRLGCARLKSCDYFRRNKTILYFIEISDFHSQFNRLLSEQKAESAKQNIKLEVRLKLSETLILYQKLLDKFSIKELNYTLKKKALLVVCQKNESDTIIFDNIVRDLKRHYCPEHLFDIKIIPYTVLENILKQ